MGKKMEAATALNVRTQDIVVFTSLSERFSCFRHSNFSKTQLIDIQAKAA